MFVQRIFQNICEISDTQAERPALFEGERVCTYGEFRGLIEELCGRLNRLELAMGSRAGIFLGNSIAGYTAVYSAALMGWTYIPLPVDDPPARLRLMIEDAGLDCILCDEQSERSLLGILQGLPSQLLPKLVNVQAAGKLDERHAPADLPMTVEQIPLYMLFTSGSTGTPKGVLIPIKGVENFVEWAKDYLQVLTSDIFLGHSRLTFDLSVFNLYVPFLAGAGVRIVKSPVEQMYPGTLLKKDVTIALTVPRVTGLMLQAGQLHAGAFPRLRHLLFCGEKLLAAQVNVWVETHPSLAVHNIYGPTETTVTCTYHRLPAGRPAEDPVPIGRTIPNMELAFLGPDMSPILGATEGDLVISGVGVSPQDYYRRETDKFFEHPELGRCFRTGDLVRRDEQGILYWLTRLDDQVKIRGFRVELAEIESVLAQHPSVLDLVCIYDPEVQVLSVFMNLHDLATKEKTIRQLQALSVEKLPAHMRPSKYLVTDNFPRNGNGKAERKEIAKFIREQVAANGD